MRADMTDISVVMATYRQAKYLEEAVESVLYQQGVPSRLYVSAVIGDRDTQIEMKSLGVRFAGRIFKLDNERPNLWHQRQRGHIAGNWAEYQCFFDSDDVMLPGWLDRGLKVAEEITSRGNIPIVGPSYRMVDEKLRPIYWTKQTKEYFEMSGPDIILPEFSMDRMMNGCIIPDFSITTTEALRSVGGLFDPDGYDPGHPYFCYATWLRLLKKYGSQVEVKLLPDIGFLYRQHRKGSHNRFQSKRHSAENVRRAREVARHYFPELGDG